MMAIADPQSQAKLAELRRLALMRHHLQERLQQRKEALAAMSDATSGALAYLQIQEGAHNVEFLRMGLAPQRARLAEEIRGGVGCLQVFPAPELPRGPVEQFLSLLSTAHIEELSLEMGKLTALLWPYVNDQLLLRALDREIRRCRTELRHHELQVMPRQRALQRRRIKGRQDQEDRYRRRRMGP